MENIRVENSAVHIDFTELRGDLVSVFIGQSLDNYKQMESIYHNGCRFRLVVIGNKVFKLSVEINRMLMLCFEMPIEQYKEAFFDFGFAVPSILQEKHRQSLNL